MAEPLLRGSFHGSYRPDDVTFLLEPTTLQPIEDVRTKERLIQSGQRHYSEMLSPEPLPTGAYLQLFREAVAQGAGKMARALVHLARRICMQRSAPLVLVSLARAGTPVGIIMRRLLREVFNLDAPHYSISIIRGRGVDGCALDHIVSRHAPQSLVFIDGWSAKGSIALELRSSLAAYARAGGVQVPAELFVLSDLSGLAQNCATHDDMLLPHALLNAAVSGLISRSVLRSPAQPGQFHGCVFDAEGSAADQSCWFVDQVFAQCLHGLPRWLAEPLTECDPHTAQQRMRALLEQLARQHGATDPHLVKPGIGEATRALLRRAPRLLLLRDPGAFAVRHLHHLAHGRAVPVELDASLPCDSVVLIESTHDA
jgi:hypothetical protein